MYLCSTALWTDTCWTLSMVTYSEIVPVPVFEWEGRETPTQLDHSIALLPFNRPHVSLKYCLCESSIRFHTQDIKQSKQLDYTQSSENGTEKQTSENTLHNVWPQDGLQNDAKNDLKLTNKTTGVIQHQKKLFLVWELYIYVFVHGNVSRNRAQKVTKHKQTLTVQPCAHPHSWQFTSSSNDAMQTGIQSPMFQRSLHPPCSGWSKTGLCYSVNFEDGKFLQIVGMNLWHYTTSKPTKPQSEHSPPHCWII